MFERILSPCIDSIDSIDSILVCQLADKWTILRVEVKFLT